MCIVCSFTHTHTPTHTHTRVPTHTHTHTPTHTPTHTHIHTHHIQFSGFQCKKLATTVKHYLEGKGVEEKSRWAIFIMVAQVVDMSNLYKAPLFAHNFVAKLGRGCLLEYSIRLLHTPFLTIFNTCKVDNRDNWKEGSFAECVLLEISSACID